MRSVGEHLNLCLLAADPLPGLAVPLEDAVDCVLARDIVSDSFLPDTNRAGIDGYAIASATVGAPPYTLPVTAEILAGDTTWTQLVSATAIRIASGAPIPPGADTLVPLEASDMGLSEVEIRQSYPQGSFVIPQGIDVSPDAVLLDAGQRLDAKKIALLAALGLSHVWVHPRVRVVVIAVGDELVEPGVSREPGQINDANGHSLAAACQECDAKTFRVLVGDDRGKLRETIEDQLVRADVILTTGGLSYGTADTVKDVLTSLGEMRFDNVAIAPGRQLGVGKIGEVPVYCLPGNPVAAQVAFETFIRPVLRKMAGRSVLYRTSVPATMTQGWTSPAGRREFVPIALTGNPGHYRGDVLGRHPQARLAALARSNAFAVVPEDVTQVEPDTMLHCMVLQ
ncbi:molybdopterin molybdotransferase MoeA [Mobiluncus mulieris]|uniref:molybdopterin molybdotransferase MoeA n=1 Tax=Mobiluncus mulieris TaxID=2052 RepID=UPI0014704466|nr:gephyrin-like molybdotransferase Glp [Mobiluncus mulieris]MCU9997028.1 molybdopterin molybdotransferase MoeA [Mobiluncus mulieris]MCV0014131.1 molybdopterin molybdotransferase MoeA [Mobiluncus mulieris]NMW61185.1 molybdopterin molybdotransferase MoeA [Mobiluncus mulieris]